VSGKQAHTPVWLQSLNRILTIAKAWLKNRVLEFAPQKELTVGDHNLDCWLLPPNTGLVWIGGMFIQPNSARTTSLLSGHRLGIDFKATDGCRDRDVSEIQGNLSRPGEELGLVKARKQLVEYSFR